jgi:hypothetical protein
VQALSNYVEVEEEEDIEVGCLVLRTLHLRTQTRLDHFPCNCLQVACVPTTEHAGQSSRLHCQSISHNQQGCRARN